MKKNRHIPLLIIICIFLCIAPGCEKALDMKTGSPTPEEVFNNLWSAMDQHYSMFTYKGVNWKNTYDQYHEKITAGMDDKALFRVLSDMLETLADGHVALISDKDTALYDAFYTNYPANFNYKNIVSNYLMNDYRTSGPIIYKMVDNVGYIYYSSFAVDATDEQVEKVFRDVQPAKGLIIDVRSNSGGGSLNANKLFAHFITSETLVKYNIYKKGPAHDDLTEPAPFYIKPSGTVYNNPVAVLTNRACFSACNDFVFYMSSLPQVKLIGDRTGGGGGIPLNYILLNGWKLQYSSSITLSAGKVNTEKGIDPGLNIIITSIDESIGRDPVIEKAFDLLH